MITRHRNFILTEAAQMLPLVRRILRDVRAARSRLSRIDRLLRQDATNRQRLREDRGFWRGELAAYLTEAAMLGVEITAGVRCEALFPFEHQWVGPQGDNKLRPAYFVYSDAEPTLKEWFFSGWPNDRRKINPKWWHQYRPTPVRQPERQPQVS